MILKRKDVYHEITAGNRHCFKHAIAGRPIIIVEHENEDIAWDLFKDKYNRALAEPIPDISKSLPKDEIDDEESFPGDSYFDDYYGR